MNLNDTFFEWIARYWLPRYLNRANASRAFRLWEKYGYHLTLNEYYSPIPDTQQLPDKLWNTETPLVGIDMNDAGQLELLQTVFPLYRDEYDRFPRARTDNPYEFHHDNAFFVGADAIVLYCMVRHFKPQRIVEIGSGYSTRLSAQAIARNGSGAITCIEPYPDDILKSHPGVTELKSSQVQAVDLRVFESLEANDLVFIDSTHSIKIGGDVTFLFLEVLPRLKPGVIVHLHDIFLPRDYPRAWILEALMFSGEQYLLQAFLTFNAGYTVLFSSSYMTIRHNEAMEQAFSSYPRWKEGCSFWMRRKAG